MESGLESLSTTKKRYIFPKGKTQGEKSKGGGGGGGLSFRARTAIRGKKKGASKAKKKGIPSCGRGDENIGEKFINSVQSP